MKFFITLTLVLSTLGVYAQISRGANFITLGNTAINGPLHRFEQYPDTTLNDSTTATGLSVSIMLNYNLAVSDHFTVGFKSRFLTDKESTYSISAFGPSVRYYFGFGADEPKTKIVTLKPGQPERTKTQNFHRFYNHESKTRLKSFFFVDASYLFGNVKFDGNQASYGEAGLMLGAMLRGATPENPLFRRLGIELSAGAMSFTNEFGEQRIIPNISAGINIFLDKKYTSHSRVYRVVQYVQVEQ